MVAQLDAIYTRISKRRALRRVLAWALFEGRPLTTRGRWINPLVFALLWLLRKLPGLRVVDRPVFIVGTGRSGTTILGVALSMHRDVGFLNEPKAIWHSALPDDDLVGSWTQAPARYRFAATDATPAARRALSKQYGGWLRVSGSTRLVDKYPELVFRVPLLHALFPDAKIIWLLRGGEETCRSVVEWSETHGVGAIADNDNDNDNDNEKVRDDWWGRNNRKWHFLLDQVAAGDPDLSPHLDWLRTSASEVDKAAVEWILAMREGLHMQRLFGGSIYPLRYEQLVKGPRKELTSLLAFCELTTDEQMLAYAERVIRDEKPPSKPAPLQLDSRLQAAFRKTSEQAGYAADNTQAATAK